ncbi:MAG TPA: GntR family transcriptional regulator [Xanthobacteraceae bacterium]|nr:GntR family transcriptional regulator [Xanthobacteraceae bacterium]
MKIACDKESYMSNRNHETQKSNLLHANEEATISTLLAEAEIGPRGQRALAVVERIRDLIVAGELAAGSRIAERTIIEQMGVGRTPLREAFKILEAEGLVSIVPNRGAVVTQLTPSDVEAVMTVLIGLEGVASEPACAQVTPAQFMSIENDHLKMMDCHRRGDLMGYFHLNQSIHQKIVDCAGNAPLSRIYKAECARIGRYRLAGNRNAARWATAVSEHEQILGAIRNREGALLRELLRVHHLNGWRKTREVLEAERLPTAQSAAGAKGPQAGKRAAAGRKKSPPESV